MHKPFFASRCALTTAQWLGLSAVVAIAAACASSLPSRSAQAQPGAATSAQPAAPTSNLTPLSSVAVDTSADPGLVEFIRRFNTDWSYTTRFYGISWSEPRQERIAALLTEWESKLKALNFDALGQQGKIDYILFRDELEHRRSQQSLEGRRLAEMSPLLPFRKDIQTLEFARRKMEEADPEAAAELLAKIPDQIKRVREQIEKGKKEAKEKGDDHKKGKGGQDKASEEKGAKPDDGKPADAKKPDAKPDTKPDTKPEPEPLRVSPVLALRTAAAADDLWWTLDRWAKYHEGFQPEFSWWVKQPREAAQRAIGEYAKFLRENIAEVKGQPEDPLIGDPIGEEALLGDLKCEKIAYTPSQLIAIANEQFAWCETEMKKAAGEMGLGEDWKAALAKVKKAHMPPGKQDDFVREESRAAIKFLTERDLITIPPDCAEMWRLEMHSPEAQRNYPFAVYGGQYMGISYPTDAMSHDDKEMSMRGNNRHFTHIVTPHELIPGHHLQGYYAERVREYRGTFSTPFLVEGWALYWEMRLWDLGWGKSPEDRVGMLFWRMHRCARIIVSLKFHLGEMTPNEMIEFLLERVGHERLNATAEVRRFIGGMYSPLYQCGYMIGGLQIRAMHRDLVEGKAGATPAERPVEKWTDKKFNDTILTYNSIPVEMIRAGMMNKPLTRDWKPEWKFAGELEGK